MSTDPILEVFVYENTQLLEQLEGLLLNNEKNTALNKSQIDEVFRVMHTIKGSSGMMGYESLGKLAHSLEDMFSKIRDTAPAKSKWESIIDVVFKSVDFFKEEIDKIQNGNDPDGEISELYQEIAEAMSSLYLETEPKKEPAKTAKKTEKKEEPKPKKDNKIASKSNKYYKIKVFFDSNAGMESVRAFSVLNSINGMYSNVKHFPQDIEINCDEEIAVNGFIIYLNSDVPEKAIKDEIEKIILIRSLDVKEVEFDETPFSDKFDIEFSEEDMNILETEPEPAVETPTSVQPDASVNNQVKKETKNEASKHSFISVNVGKVDKLMNLVGEIVTTESMVIKSPDLVGLELENFEKQARQLRKLTDELQDIVMSIRMVPISSTFHKMQRIVHDMSKKIGKETNLEIIGETTEVDKNVIDNLSDPLMHLIRNAMDHGLETPSERAKAGKNPVGTLTLEAQNTGGDVVVTVSDDGKGLDRHSIIQKAIEKGLTTKSESEITDKEAFSFIMAPGFSTKDKVSEFSGRGVGMDVVHKNIGNIGGSITIDSEFGVGTSIKMHIPLTLAILDGMKVSVGDSQFIVPTLNIIESIEPKLHKIVTNPDGTELAIVRGESFEIIRAHKLFGIENPKAKDLNSGIMLILESEHGNACLFVDELIGEQQAVIKPIPAYITTIAGKLKGIAGCTILGDGSISLIMDINSLLS